MAMPIQGRDVGGNVRDVKVAAGSKLGKAIKAAQAAEDQTL